MRRGAGGGQEGLWLSADDPQRGALSPGEDVLGGVGGPVREGAVGDVHQVRGVAMSRGALCSGEPADADRPVRQSVLRQVVVI
jgi:hypothetical protein